MLRSPLRVLVLIAIVTLAPNLFWAFHSSVLLRNTGADPLTLRLVLEDEPAQLLDLGTLAPGEAKFLWIDPIGEATLSVEIEDAGLWNRHCAAYVEEAMYRVEITLSSPSEAVCQTSLPLFERLLIREVLS